MGSRASARTSTDPPAVPTDPVIEVSGAVAEPFALPLAELATPLPRADRGLPLRGRVVRHRPALGGRRFRDRLPHDHRAVGATRHVDHPRRRGLDGFQAVVSIEDALAEDVLIAERDGDPRKATAARLRR